MRLLIWSERVHPRAPLFRGVDASGAPVSGRSPVGRSVGEHTTPIFAVPTWVGDYDDGRIRESRVTGVGKVAFEGGGAFLRETRREVELYLSDARTRRSGIVRLYAKAVIALAATVSSWTCLLLAPHEPMVVAVCFAGLALGLTLIAFCVQHDANHGAHFRQERYNHLLGWTADALLGFSSYTWRVKHNVSHHTYTNVDGCDDDVSQVPLARFAPSQQPRAWYRFQHLYIWLLYTLVGVRWQTAGDLVSLIRGRFAQSTLRFPRGWNLAALVTGKALFFSWTFVVPLFFFPWWVVFAVYAGWTMILSLVMVTTFQLAHCVEEASFVSRDELIAERRVWAVHQVETTVDFCPHNRILTWLLGGLNFQIEHHLFPGIPHTHYPAIAPIVQRNCLKHDVRYMSQRSLASSIHSHFRHLRRMGQLGLPVSIEMG
jgi:linoleoyl-CoA desaturase